MYYLNISLSYFYIKIQHRVKIIVNRESGSIIADFNMCKDYTLRVVPMNKIFILLTTLFSLCITEGISQCTPSSVPYPNMGINLPDAENIPWINLYHQINPYHSSARGLNIGSDGWPTTGTNHFVIGADIGTVIPIQGVVKVSYKGTKSQFSVNNSGTIIGANSKDDFPASGYAYIEVNVPTAIVGKDGNGNELEFKIEGHAEDIKFMRPGFEIDETRIVHPQYADLLKNYSTLRFMPFLSTNTHMVTSQWDCDGPLSIDWSNRSSPNTPQPLNQLNTKGGAWEMAVAIANDMNKDMWINIPVIASDNYINGLAQYLKSNLNPSLKVNFELGNEIWNSAGGFCVYRQVAKLAGGDNNPNFARWNGVRIKQVVDIFATVWGWSEINNRIRATLCGQIGYGVWPYDVGRTLQPSIEYLENTFGVGTVKKYIYALGVAPYFGPHGNTSSVDDIISSSSDDINNVIFGQYSDELWNGIRTANKLENWMGWAGYYGLKLFAYEGGPDMDYTTGGGGVKNTAMQDPRMEDLCKTYWNKWYSRYGNDALFCFFLGGFNTSGLYTLGESFSQTSTRQKAMNQIMSSPSPAFDKGFRHIIPGTILASQAVGYMETYDKQGYLRYLHGGGWAEWVFGAQENGKYTLSINRNSSASEVDIYMDGILVKDNWPLPGTNGSEAWSPDIPLDLSYGVHAIRINFNQENGDYKELKFTLISKTPPFQPAAIQGDLNVCSGNPKAKYTVDNDASVCTYTWTLAPTAVAAGAKILPFQASAPGQPASGQNTNLIYIDWGNTPAGTYSLKVKGSNNNGDSPERTVNITLGTCGFVVNPTQACMGENINVVPAIVGTVTTWNWIFDKGGTTATPSYSTAQNPGPFSYSATGLHNIELKVTMSDGSTKTFSNIVNVRSTGCIKPVISNVTTTDPTTCVATNGNLVFTLSGGFSDGEVYQIDMNGNGIFTDPIDKEATSVSSKLTLGNYKKGEVLAATATMKIRQKSDVTQASNGYNFIGYTFGPASPDVTLGAVSPICSGSTTFSLPYSGTTGNPISYSINAGTPAMVGFSDITDAALNASPLTIAIPSSAAAGSYQFSLTLKNANSCISAPKLFSLVINQSAVGGTTTTPTPTICAGQTATLELSGHTGTIQWQQSATGTGSWANVSAGTGANSASYTTSALTTNMFYRAGVTSGNCPTVYTSPATQVTVTPASSGGTSNAAQTVLAQGGNTDITLSGYIGTIAKWQISSTNGTSYIDITPLQTNATFNTGPLTTPGDYYYKAEVKSGSCQSTFSSAIKITVNNPSTAGTASTSTPTLCSGSSGSLSLSGNTGSVIWQDSTVGGKFNDILNSSGQSHTTSALTATRWFRAKVTGGTGIVYSNVVAIAVSPLTIGGTASADQTEIIKGGNANINLTGQTGAIVKWQMSTDRGITYTDIAPSQTNATFNSGALDMPQDYYYKAEVKSGSCQSTFSSPIKITVNNPSAAGIASTSTPTLCSGSPGSLSLSGNIGSVIWQDSTVGGKFNDILTSSGQSHTTSALTADRWFRAKVTGANGIVYSNTVVITVNPISIGGTATASEAVVVQGENTEISLSGQTGTITKWEISTDGGNVYTAIDPLQANISFNTGSLDIPRDYYYRAIVKSGVCSEVNSTSIKVTVNGPSTAGTASTTTPTLCAGNTAILTLSGSVGSIFWQDSIPGGVFNDIAGANAQSHTTQALTANGYFRAKVIGGSGTVYSNTVTITINPNAQQPGDFTSSKPIVCQGETNVTYTVPTAQNATSYKWMFNGSILSENRNSLVMDFNSTSVSGTLSVQAENSCNTSEPRSLPIQVSRLPAQPAQINGPNVLCANSADINYSVPSSNATDTYSWSFMGTGISPLTGTTNAINVSVSSTATSGTLQVYSKNSCGQSEIPSTIELRIEPKVRPTAVISSPSSSICGGSSVAFSVEASGEGESPSFTWFINGVDANVNLPTYTSNSLKDGDVIGVKVTSSSECRFSDFATDSFPEIKVIALPAIADNIVGPNLVCQGSTNSYAITAQTGVTYNWEWPVSISKSTASNINTLTLNWLGSPQQPETISVTVQNQCGSSEAKSILVNRDPKCDDVLFVPNVITPDENNTNSVWNIEGLAIYPDSEIKIFNRWGSLIFSAVGNSKPWDGTIKGEPLPTGTYYYVIDLKNGKSAVTGSVTIIRS